MNFLNIGLKPGVMNFDMLYLYFLQLLTKDKELLSNSFFQYDFVSRLHETMKLVTPVTSAKIFFRKDGGS